MNRLYFHLCRFILFFIAASVSFNGFYEKWHFGEPGVTGEYELARFESMVDGTAYRPYVYRQMLPEIANLTDRYVPQSVKSKLYIHQGSGIGAYVQPMAASPTAQSRTYFFRYLVVYTLTFLFALLAVYAMSWVCHALQIPETAATFAPVLLILLIPYLQSGGGYFYDFSELALFALAVFAALRFEWFWIIPIAALGAWNKESFLFIILTLYPFIRRRHSQATSLVAIGVLCAVCLSVSMPIRMHFVHNPGSTVEPNFTGQMEYFLHFRKLIITTEQTYGIHALRAYTLFPMAMLIWMVRRAWTDLSPVIRRHAKIAAIVNIPLYILFCAAGELRDLSMLYIALLLVIAVNISNWVRNTATLTVRP